MNISNVAQALFIALGFVGWGIVIKYTGATHSWVAVIVYKSALIVLLVVNAQPLLTGNLPTIKMTAILAVGGILNGLAVHLYAKCLSKPEIDPAVFMLMVFAFMVLETPLLNWAIYNKIPNSNQIIACVLAIGASYFLNK
jgi:hypothetical protein